MHFIDYILLFGLAVLSGFLYLYIKPKANILKLVLTFSGAYLFCLTAIHLLPELYSDRTPLKTGIFIVVGFVLQIILENSYFHPEEVGITVDEENNFSKLNYEEKLPLI